MECLSLSILLKHLQDQDDNGEHVVIYAHLSTGCQVCHENLQWLNKVITLAAEDKSFEFSEETLAAIVTRLKEQVAIDLQIKEQKPIGLQPIRRFFAELIFDSGGLPQLVEARLRSKEPLVRRTLYQAEGYNIDLKFTWSNKSNDERLDGQVLLKDCGVTTPAQVKVELLQQGSVVFSATTDEYGVFECYRLTPGTYEMKIIVPDGEINLTRVSTAYAL
jgi:hypothetical protein